jgi:hypothetical protein
MTMRKPLSILMLCFFLLGISAASASAQNLVTDDAYIGVGGEQQGNLPGGSTPGDQGGQGAGPDGIAGQEEGNVAVPLQDGQSLPSPDTSTVADRGEGGADLPLTGLQIALLALASLALVSAGLAVRWMSPGRAA